MKHLLFLILLTGSLFTYAGDKGNGGCPTCQKSYDLALKTVTNLYDLDFKKIQKAVPQIDSLNELLEIAQNRKVLPGTKKEQKDRVLMSFVDTQTTKIRVKKYKKLSFYEKIKMEVHEILVLAEIEKDGVYTWTTRLMKLLPNYERLTKFASSYGCNDDTCTIYGPKANNVLDLKSHFGYTVLKDGTSLNGICKFFGLSKNISHNIRNIKKERAYHLGRIDELGVVYDLGTYKCEEGCDYISAIKCEKN